MCGCRIGYVRIANRSGNYRNNDICGNITSWLGPSLIIVDNKSFISLFARIDLEYGSF